jgi:hypothetical protein
VDHRLNAAFDKSVFSQPAPFTFGTLTPRANLRNNGFAISPVDLQTVAPMERLCVQFRAGLLNAFNTPRSGIANTSATATAFGVISSQAKSPRQTQFGLKFLG